MANAPSHPSPERYNVKASVLTVSLFGALAAWVMQMELSEMLSSRACYPHNAPLPAPLWGWAVGALAVINVAGILGSAISTLIAWRAWRQARKSSGDEGHHVMEVGEGRLRFLAMMGAWISVLFLVATVFTACAMLLVAPCAPWSGV